MKLLELEVYAFRGAPDGHWSFQNARTGRAHDTIAIVGGAASGKTSLLLAIVMIKESMAPSGLPPDHEACVRSGEVEGRIAGTWVLTDDERSFAGLDDNVQRVEIGLGRLASPPPPEGLRRLFRSFQRGGPYGKVELFPPARSLGVGMGDRIKPMSEAQQIRLRTSVRSDKYFDMPRWILERATSDALAAREIAARRGIFVEGDAPDSLSRFRRGLRALVPDLAFEGVHEEAHGRTLRFVRRNETRVVLADLAGSEEQAVLFAATFARIGLDRAVVLIDTPELAVAPDCHESWFRGLGRLGEDNQIFAATSSERVAAALPPDQVVRLSQR